MPYTRSQHSNKRVPISDDDEQQRQQAAFISDMCIENRRVCGNFTILKSCGKKNQPGVYKVLTESGQIQEMTDVEIEEMINPNNLPRFCYMLPGYEHRRLVTGRRLSLWVQSHVMELEGFLPASNCLSEVVADDSDNAAVVLVEKQQQQQQLATKFKEWEGKDDFSLPWKKRVLLEKCL
jgi:hypothetical protein